MPNVTGRPVRRWTSAIQRDLGAGALVVGAGLLEARRDLVHAALLRGRARRRSRTARRSSAQVPGTERPSGTRCSSVRLTSRSRARPRPSPRRRASAIARDVVVGGGLLVDRALAHHVVAHRAVPDHAADVDALRQPVDRVEVLAVGLASPTRGRRGCSPRGCPRPTPSARRGTSRSSAGTGANVTPQLPSTADVTPCQHDDVAERVPVDLRVEVRVDVDEAGRDDPAVGVESRAGPGRRRAPTVVMRSPSIATSAGRPRRTRAVDDRAVANHQIVRHGPKYPRVVLDRPDGPSNRTCSHWQIAPGARAAGERVN